MKLSLKMLTIEPLSIPYPGMKIRDNLTYGQMIWLPDMWAMVRG